MGPKTSTPSGEGGEEWELRRAADVRVWEDKTSYERVDGERMSKRRKSDGSWMVWVRNMEESGLAWVEKKLKNENWKGSILDDTNVSILQEAFAQTKHTPSASATTASKPVLKEHDTQLTVRENHCKELVPFVDQSDSQQEVAIETVPIADNALIVVSGEELAGEKDEEVTEIVLTDATPTLLDEILDRKLLTDGVQNHGVNLLQIPIKLVEPAAITTSAESSPYTDLDDTPVDPEKGIAQGLAFVRRNSVTAKSGRSARSSDLDSPAQVKPLSNSGKLKLIENLGDFIEELEHEPSNPDLKKSPVLKVLQPTTADLIADIKDRLHGFVGVEEQGDESSTAGKPEAVLQKPSSPLFKALPGVDEKKTVGNEFSSDDDTPSGDEAVSDSDSDSAFEIFPPAEPPKMKLHPPVKLDVQHFGKKLGTPVQLPDNKVSSLQGEILTATEKS